MKNESFTRLLADRYPSIKDQHPGEGRRRWQLRVLQEFLISPQIPISNTSSSRSLADDFIQDTDPFDQVLEEGSASGLLLRTDYSDDEAWTEFHARLQAAETEFVEMMKQGNSDSNEFPQGQAAEEEAMDDGARDEDDSDEESDGIPYSILKVISPDSPRDRSTLSNISNLTALRLLNDVDIRPAPSPPIGTKRITPPNSLIDYRGWQEIYSGMNIWIYDAQSNSDHCVRQVSQQGNIYGTATGDSWRARVTHICELQFNMAHLGMKIDFGGLDRWDYSERRRNLEEAIIPVT